MSLILAAPVYPARAINDGQTHYRGMDLTPLSAGLQGHDGIELRLRN